MKIKIWISALTIILLSSSAMAQDTSSTKETRTKNSRTERPAFTDNNKDGICDNAGTNQVRGNSKGTCKGPGGQKGNGNSTRRGSCQNF